MRTTLATAVATATLLACAACTSSDPQDPDTTPATTPTPTVAATPTSTASPTPASTAVTADGVIDRTDEDLGIVFTDLPDVTGPAIDALNTYTLFETDFWKATTTSKVPDDLAQITSNSVFDTVKTQADTNKKNGYTIDGVNRIAIIDLKDTSSTKATIVTCQSDEDWVVTNKSGDTEKNLGPVVVTATVERPSGMPAWQVSTYTLGDAC